MTRSVMGTVSRSSASLSNQAPSCRCRCTITAPSTGLSSPVLPRSQMATRNILLTENQSTYIPLGVVHSLANPGKVPLELIEIQSGSYLGEDDIVRFEDRYGRV